MEVKHNCSGCQHRRDALVPGEWLESQDHIILDCPHYEKEKTLCDNCIHKPVCSIYRATGGVKSCEHHKEERRGEWLSAYEYGLKLGIADEEKLEELKKDKFWKFCNDCEQSVKGFHNYCPNCGADMRGVADGQE